MREHFIASFKVSLEWRVIAFIVTNVYLWVTTGSFWEATATALALQGILFVIHFVWVLWRYGKHGLTEKH